MIAAALRLALRVLAALWVGLPPLPRERGVIYALWHGDMLPWILPLAGEGRAVMVSLSADGELLARVLRPLGYHVVRGSSSRRGGEALEELIPALREGRDVILAVDGPRGPRERVHTGVLRIAARTGAPVVALGVAASRARRLGSWDGFLIPWPLSRVVWSVSGPIGVSPDLEVETVRAGCAALGARLRRQRHQAEVELLNANGLELHPLRWVGAAVGVYLAMALAAPLLLLSLLHPRARLLARAWVRAWRGAPPPPGLWIHAASHGESQIAAHVAGQVPGGVGLTCTRPEVALRWEGRPPWVWVAALLPDLPGLAGWQVERLRPRALVLVEGELWPFTLRAALRRGVPLLWLSARISERSARRLRWLRPWIAPSLAQLTAWSARTAEDGRRFEELGAPAARRLPDLDLKRGVGASPPPPDVEGWLGAAPLLVAGSTHREDEDIALAVFAGLRARWPELRLVVAPRDVERAGEVRAACEAAGIPTCLRSRLERGRVGVVLDTMGELAGLYPLAAGALLGGTWGPVGGHNPWELASAGVPFVVGPHTERIDAALGEIAQVRRAQGVGDATCHLAERMDPLRRGAAPGTPARDPAWQVIRSRLLGCLEGGREDLL